MNEVIRQLKERKSVRVFTDKEITPKEVSVILEAAVNAPTAGNQQLYTIINVTDPKLKEQLAESCDHQPFIAKAPLVLVFCADCRKWYNAFEKYGCSPRKPGVGDLMLAVSDANIAAQNAVVAAQSLGIGSCYIGDIMENAENNVSYFAFRLTCSLRQCLFSDIPPSNKFSAQNHPVHRCTTLCTKTHIAIWIRRNSKKCFW